MSCRKWISLIVVSTLVASVGAKETNSRRRRHRCENQRRNVILMVGDGMGLSHVAAARIFKGGPNGDPLSFEQLNQIGYQRTHSAGSTVTDSAAAASAWATGDKYRNGQISWHSNTNMPETVLEIAKKKGKATGLVATSTITHATPAAFGSHVSTRYAEREIARQYIEETKVDVILGGGFGLSSSSYPVVDLSALIGSATNEYGYVYASNVAELEQAAVSCSNKLLGLFKKGAKTQERYHVNPAIKYPEGEPTLAQMTEAALHVLSKDKDGFFLLVEGSQIDWSSHANNVSGMIGELLAFEASVKVVVDWLDANPRRWKNTLLIVASDHETGGLQINGPSSWLSGPGEIIQAGWTTGGHTGVDTLVWSEGVGSEHIGGSLDNTDLFKVMEWVLR